MKSAIAAGLAVLVSMSACGGSDEPSADDVAATVAEACATARDAIARLPVPTDSASDSAWFSDFYDAAMQVSFDVRDLNDGLAVPEIDSVDFQLQRFPREIGNMTPSGVALDALGKIRLLDRAATELDVAECGAASWRPDVWEAILDRVADRPTVEAFTAELTAACTEGPMAVTGGPPSAGGILAGQWLDTFGNYIDDIVPPVERQDDYIDLIAALQDVDHAIPDVLTDGLNDQQVARLEASTIAADASMVALGVIC